MAPVEVSLPERDVEAWVPDDFEPFHFDLQPGEGRSRDPKTWRSSVF